MFPYAIITASRLLNKPKSNRPSPPLINTLPNYIQMPTERFWNLIIKKSTEIGFFEMYELRENWHNFDSLSEKEKTRFIKEIVEPEYYSVSNRIKRAFKKMLAYFSKVI